MEVMYIGVVADIGVVVVFDVVVVADVGIGCDVVDVDDICPALVKELATLVWILCSILVIVLRTTSY